MNTTITKVLVPTDFSPTADAALAYAKTLAERVGASLVLVHVIDDAYMGGSFGGEVYVPDAPGLRAMLTKESEELLAKRVTDRDKAVLKAQTAVVVGRAFHSIVEFAQDQQADLIVMGTHGRTGMAHLLLGSVAERIVRTAPCPVLTVRDAPVHVPAAVRVPIMPAETII